MMSTLCAFEHTVDATGWKTPLTPRSLAACSTLLLDQTTLKSLIFLLLRSNWFCIQLSFFSSSVITIHNKQDACTTLDTLSNECEPAVTVSLSSSHCVLSGPLLCRGRVLLPVRLVNLSDLGHKRVVCVREERRGIRVRKIGMRSLTKKPSTCSFALPRNHATDKGSI